MRKLQKLVAVAAALVLASTGAAFAAAYDQLFCTVGGSGSQTFSADGSGPGFLEISNEAGATIALSATLMDPAELGYLEVSGGPRLMTFPGTTTATITTAYPAMTFLMLAANHGDITVTATCNPSNGAQTPSDQSQNPASSTSQTRDAEREFLEDLAAEMARSAQQKEALISYVAARLGWDRQRLEAIYDYHYEATPGRVKVVSTTLGWIQFWGKDLDNPKYNGTPAAIDQLHASMRQAEQDLLEAEAHFQNSQGGALGYAAAPTSSAVAAINRAAGDSVVQGTFNALGYGPNGRFDTSAELARGDNWRIVASANGAISQTSLAAGNTNSISGRGTINLVVSPATNLGLGLALGLGATSEDGAALDDAAYHYSATGTASYMLAPNLTARGTLGYELTSHNYTLGAATGNSMSHLFTAGLGLTGKLDVDEFTFTPRLDADLQRESADETSMSDGSTLAGFDRTTGRVTIGGALSRDLLWDSANSRIIVTPSLGLDTSLSFTDKTTTTGVATTSTLLGLGITAGLAFQLESGVDLSLSGRLTRAGETTGASLTGSLSAGF